MCVHAHAYSCGCVHVCMQVYRHEYVCVQVRSSSFTLYLVFWDRFSHCTWHSPFHLGWPGSKLQGDSSLSPTHSQFWGYRHTPSHPTFAWMLEIRAEVPMLSLQMLYHPNSFSSSEIFFFKATIVLSQCQTILSIGPKSGSLSQRLVSNTKILAQILLLHLDYNSSVFERLEIFKYRS